MKNVRKWLALSLVLNVFLVGVVVGGYLWVQNGDRPIAAGALRIAGSELPAEEGKAMRRAMRQTRRAQSVATHESWEARREVAGLLREPRPDRAAILALLSRARAADMVVRGAVEQRAVDFAIALPGADRNKLAQAMVRRAEKNKPAP